MLRRQNARPSATAEIRRASECAFVLPVREHMRMFTRQSAAVHRPQHNTSRHSQKSGAAGTDTVQRATAVQSYSSVGIRTGMQQKAACASRLQTAAKEQTRFEGGRGQRQKTGSVQGAAVKQRRRAAAIQKGEGMMAQAAAAQRFYEPKARRAA